jgi:hypothetical protein
MTDEKEFGFEEEEKDPREGLPAPPLEDTTELPGDPHPGGKGSRPRTLLVILLLIVLGAAGYFYLFGMGGVSTPPPSPMVKKQPIVMPPKPEPAPIPKPAAAPAEASPEAVTQVPQPPPITPAVVSSAEKGGAGTPEKVPAGSVPEGQPRPTAQTSALPSIPAPAAVMEEGVRIPARGDYTIDAGAFMLHSNQVAVENKLHQLGFEPRLTAAKQMEHMTRLRVGAFPAAEARARLQEVDLLAPGSFLVAEGDKLVLYAGSYYTLDKARIIADRLFVKGVLVKEEQVEVPVPVHLVSFGDFTDLESARKAAEKARAAGLEVNVRKVR